MEGKDFYEKLEEETRRGGLMPCMGLVRRLMLCVRRSSLEMRNVLAGQVEIARSRGNHQWLRTVARDAEDYQLASREWIDGTIWVVRRRSVESAESRKCTTDIRLKTEPGLERVVENAASAPPPPERPDILMDELQELINWNPALDYEDVQPAEDPTPVVQEVEDAPRRPPARSRSEADMSASSQDQSRSEPARRKVTFQLPITDEGNRGKVARSNLPTEATPGTSRQRGDVPKLKLVVNTRKGEKSSTTSTVCSSKSVHKSCPIPWCAKEYAYPKAHAFNFHYPTKLDIRAGGRKATRDRIEALEYLAVRIVGPGASPLDLMERLNQLEVTRRHGEKQIDAWVLRVVRDVSRELGLVVPRTLSLYPLNSPVLVFHWLVLMEALRLLDEREHNLFMRLFALPSRRSELRQRLAEFFAQEGGKEPSRAVEQEVPEREGLDRLEVVNLEIVRGPQSNDRVVKLCSTKVEPDAGMEVSSCRTGAVTGVEAPGAEVEVVAGDETVSRPEVMMEVDEAEIAEGLGQAGSSVEVAEEDLGRTKPSETSDGVASGFDSHFHIDRLGRELGLATYNLRELQRSAQPMDQSNRVNLCGAVANFCDPITYPSQEDILFLKSQGIATTVGLHPKHAAGVSAATISRLQGLLQLPEVVGLGEIGLDHTAPIEEWAVQRDVLATTLGLMEPRHVLVLHCRGRHEAEFSELLASLFYQCVGIVPREKKIHLHCFQGLKEEVTRWTEHFVNVHFGFTNLVSRRRFTDEHIQALRGVEPSRLLLETDAPYFAPPGYSISAPWFIGMTAAAVARLRGEEVERVLAATTRNGMNLYSQ